MSPYISKSPKSNTMNILKALVSVFILMICTTANSQEVPSTYQLERVIIFVEDIAIVAVLDEEGLVKKKIMELPDYFDQKHDDEYYIQQSLKILTDQDLTDSIEGPDTLSPKLATSESFKTEN